jgi:phosphoadenosine phosphosulfate reductase
MKKVPEQTLVRISDSFEESTPQEILRWAVDNYHPRLCMATAFGAEGCVILSMLAEIQPDVYVFNLDTGYQFEETKHMKEVIKERYGILVQPISAEETVQSMETRYGGPIYDRHPDECCRIRKIEPLKRAIKGWSAWITAIRREQTGTRAKAGIVEWDNKFQIVKINPLANWTKKQLWDYISEENVPYNPLHDQGFPSIGCWPCTRAVQDGEDDRAGRWANFARKECGIHLQETLKSFPANYSSSSQPDQSPTYRASSDKSTPK